MQWRRARELTFENVKRLTEDCIELPRLVPVMKLECSWSSTQLQFFTFTTGGNLGWTLLHFVKHYCQPSFEPQRLQPGPHCRRPLLHVWPECHRSNECEQSSNQAIKHPIRVSSIASQVGDEFRVVLVRGCLGVDGGQYLSFLGHRLAPSLPWEGESLIETFLLGSSAI